MNSCPTSENTLLDPSYLSMDPSPRVDSYTDILLKYMPAESVALCLTLQGIVLSSVEGPPLNTWLWFAFGIGIIGTPLYLWRIQQVSKIAQLAVSATAFGVWVFALGGAFASLSWYIHEEVGKSSQRPIRKERKGTGMEHGDDQRIERVSSNVAELLSEVLEENTSLKRETERLRLRIKRDLQPLIEELPPKDRGRLISLLTVRVQEIIESAGSPKVSLSRGCLEREGAGIRVTDEGSGVFAEACVIGTLDEGPSGSGVGGGFTFDL